MLYLILTKYTRPIFMKKLYITIAIITLILIGIVTMYNRMVSKHQSVLEAWSNVESTLQRRYDLIPNLVSTVKGYANHEKETFQAVTEARSSALQTILNVDLTNPATMEKMVQMQGNLAGALSKLIAVAEAYPDLKASKSFLELQSQLEGTENRINVARTRYNSAAKTFNTGIRMFPANIINKTLGGFATFNYFESVKDAETVPQVQF